jgi:hypothetical protein
MPSAPGPDRSTIRFARALLTAVLDCHTSRPRRSELEASIDYLVATIRAVSRDGILSVGIEPGTLLIEGAVSAEPDDVISEAASLLRQHELARMTFVGEVRRSAVRSLLQLLALDEATRRSRGGLADIWARVGDSSIVLEEITQDAPLNAARPEGVWQELPPELPEWMHTLGQASIRTLSIGLLIDLLTLEDDAVRASEIAGELRTLAEDLLWGGAYGDAKAVLETLANHARDPRVPGAGACHAALEQLRTSSAMRDAVMTIKEVEQPTASLIEGLASPLASRQPAQR